MYYAMRASAPSLHRESTDSLIMHVYTNNMCFLTLYSRCCNRPYNIQESIKLNLLWIYESSFPFPHIL